MKKFISAPLFLAAFAATGCILPRSVPFIDAEAQECVDGALHRDPDRTVLHDAWKRFDQGCRAGDPAACSLLGVMHERGLTVRSDLQAARGLYERACKAGNSLGCMHFHRARRSLAFTMPAVTAESSTARR